MKLLHPRTALLLAALLLAPALGMAAGDEHGHDHPHGDAAPTTGAALPRFAAVSDLFELVGVLQGKQITLYLDRAADNSPVAEAQIELEIAGQKFKATRQGADQFEVVLPDVPKPGVLAITATVVAGADADLLAGELDIHEVAHAGDPAPVRAWQVYAGWGVAGVVVLVLLVIAGHRVLSSRQTRAGVLA